MNRMQQLIKFTHCLDKNAQFHLSDRLTIQCAKWIKSAQTLCLFCGKPQDECDCYFECPIHHVKKGLCPCSDLCLLCNRTRKNCVCDPCKDCGEIPLNCKCDRCHECHELLDDCECDRCPHCNCLEEDCECDRCSNCNKLIEDCECERCSHCNELEEDCECSKCDDCGELKENCTCTSDFFTEDTENIERWSGDYNRNRLSNQLGLDLERLRLAILRKGTVSSDQKLQLQQDLQSKLQSVSEHVARSRQMDPAAQVGKVEMAIQALQKQIETLQNSPTLFVWDDATRKLRDKIANEMKKLGINPAQFGDILHGQYTQMSSMELAQTVERLEEHISASLPPGHKYPIGGASGIKDAFWGFYGQHQREMLISLTADQVDMKHYGIWETMCLALGAHRKTSSTEIAFAFVVNTGAYGQEHNDYGNFWIVSQMQSDVCSKMLKKSDIIRDDMREGIDPYSDTRNTLFLNVLRDHNLTANDFSNFCKDPNVQFILNNWADILMKRVSYLARRAGASVILMEDVPSIASRIAFGNSAKPGGIYGGIHRRHGFEPYSEEGDDDEHYFGYDRKMLGRVAQKS